MSPDKQGIATQRLYGHLWHDEDFKFIAANFTACQILGYSECELLQMRLQDVEPDFDQYGVIDRLQSLQLGEQLALSGCPTRRDGTQVPLDICTTVIRSQDSRIFAVELSCDQHHILPAFDHVAHELNNCGTTLLTILEELRQHQRSMTVPRAMDTSAISFVSRQIASLSTALQNRHVAQPRVVALSPLIARTLANCRYTVFPKFGDLHIVHPPPQRPILIRVNPERVEQVFHKIFLNAIQAMHQAPRKELSIQYDVDPAEGVVRCHIQDSGAGISAQVVAQMFRSGFSTKPDDGNGHGLGMSIIRSIIHSYNGELAVRSQPGQGTTMTVSLPTYSPSP
jgi:PAS domain S-box-containing protein